MGLVSLNTAITLPHPELGWILWDAFEGQGYAYEAASNARNFAFEILGWMNLLSGIHEDNHASIRLAERMQAEWVPSLRVPEEPETRIYRHERR